MPVDLVSALVGWLVSLVGDAGTRKWSDVRALRRAMELAIDRVVEQVDPVDRECLRRGLRDCFSDPPRPGSVASTSVGLRDAIVAQVAQLGQMKHGESGQPFYEAVQVKPEWLCQQICEAIPAALRQTVAASGLTELVHALDAEDVRAQLGALTARDSELRYGPLVRAQRESRSSTPAWRGPVWSVPPLRGDEVVRPGLMGELVAAVTGSSVAMVGMTTGLWGAGGFGKTTLARLLAHRNEVRERFPDGAVWVTVGEAVGPELGEKITNVVGLLCGVRPPVTDPLAAGTELGRVLGDRRVLLVLDDVWTTAQVEPFLIGGPGAVRLFTTRNRGVLSDSAQLVRVDEMGRGEAEQLLTAGVSEVSAGLVAGLSAATGRWPVLLGLAHGAVRADQHAGRRAEDSMREILQELRARGPSALDVSDDQERHTAVARTIEVSLSRLSVGQRDRYLELAVFREGVMIPITVLARYWEATGACSAFEARRFCQRLAGLALVRDYWADPGRLVVHNVIHGYLREQCRHRRGELHEALIDAHRSLVAREHGMSAWWQLPTEEDYLWLWLPTHLRGAGLDQELCRCVQHTGWLIGKLEQVGPAGLEADLALSDDPLSRALGRAVRQNAHILRPLQPPGSLTATLATRLSDEGPTRVIVERLVTGLTGPHLRAVTALPDLSHPALSRVLSGYARKVKALVVAPDGSWLASASDDQTVRVWDPATGTVRHTLTGHTGVVTALAVAPDGSWLASAGDDGQVRVWDLAIGAGRQTGYTGAVRALVVAPDGS